MSRPGESTDQFLVHLGIEADDHRRPRLVRGRPQVARRPEQQAGERVVVGPILGEVDARDLLPLGDEQRLRVAEDLEGAGRVVALLLGVDDLGDLDIVGRKKLLRAGARRSALPLVAPVDLARHSAAPFACLFRGTV